MRQRVWDTMQARDTVGGVFEVVALGLPPGLGSHVHWDRRLSGRLLGAVGSIHAIKGVEIGPAFENAARWGTEVHDEIFLEGEGNPEELGGTEGNSEELERGGRLVRRTNRAGGLEGGITTGEPLVLRVAMKPISTTLNPLRSVNLATGQPDSHHLRAQRLQRRAARRRGGRGHGGLRAGRCAAGEAGRRQPG